MLSRNIAQTERHDGLNLVVVAGKQPMVMSPDVKNYMRMLLKGSIGGTIAWDLEFNTLGESWG